MPLVSVEHLTKVYARRHADGSTPGVTDVSFDIAPGETLGLVGASGSGKTTIGRAVLRLIEPTTGRVTMRLPSGDTVDVTALSASSLRRFRRNAQMIFQDPYTALNPRMTVAAAIAEPLRLHAVVPAAAVAGRSRRLIEMVGLDPSVLAERPDALSGGQRQRVVIARAIATNPCFVVADEPVTALDVSVQAQILNLLKDIQTELGVGFLFISHDLAVVSHMADRIAVVAEGRIVEVGPAADVLLHPRDVRTRRLVDVARRRSVRVS